MNYYERHLGDYARDTGHLTMLEHGAYTLLLDRYYITEAGIEADQVHRVARARTRDEKAAVDAVLNEFFRLVDGRWVQGRAEGEIRDAHHRIETARKNGKNGGRPKKQKPTDDKPNGFSSGSEMETGLKAHQAPSTNLQSPESANALSARAALVPRFKAAGILPEIGHQDYGALVDAGVTWEEFEPHVSKALGTGHPFRYLVATVIGERQRAAKRGPIPAAAPSVQAESFRERDERLARERADEFMGRKPANHARQGEIIDMEASDVAPRLLG